MSPGDLGWMAAIIDAKGATVRKNNQTRNTPQIVLRVSTKDPRIAARLSRLTGTSPESRTIGPPSFLRRGCTEHCPEPHIHVEEDPLPWQLPATTTWTITGAAAAVILINLAPYMTTYGDYEGDVNQILMNIVTHGKGVGMVRTAVTRLKDLGWAIPRKIEIRLGLGATRDHVA